MSGRELQQFLSLDDVSNIRELVEDGLVIANNPYAWGDLGKNRTLGLIFMNPSLRTRLSTQKAGMNLGMNVMVMNVAQDGWKLEMEDGAVMDGDAQEHIVEAARVVSQYCDVIGLRTFAALKDRRHDYSEPILGRFADEATVPMVNMESATGHPLQALADVMTIEEERERTEATGRKPRVVLTWAPHPRALPQAVANSFVEWTRAMDYDVVVTHPEGYELDDRFLRGAEVEHDQEKALDGADFVYAKNWSATGDADGAGYGSILSTDASWMINGAKMDLTNDGKFMHCLPVRRNVIVADEVLDSDRSIVIRQAKNREYAAQTILKGILEGIIRNER